jgi:DNA polymerase III epsilon subunit-like protein
LKELKTALGTSVTRLVAFDIEAFEFNSRALLELGAAVFEMNLPSDPMVPAITAYHFIMTENKNKKNGRFCENNRGNFCFGKSKTMPTDKVLQWLRHQISQPGTAIVGHNLASDLKFLREARVHGGHKGLDKVLSSVAASFDTQHIFQQVMMFDSPSKLGFILDHYGVSHDYLHNAGNDAYYTMVGLLKIASVPFVEQTPKLFKTTKVHK